MPPPRFSRRCLALAFSPAFTLIPPNTAPSASSKVPTLSCTNDLQTRNILQSSGFAWEERNRAVGRLLRHNGHTQRVRFLSNHREWGNKL